MSQYALIHLYISGPSSHFFRHFSVTLVFKHSLNFNDMTIQITSIKGVQYMLTLSLLMTILTHASGLNIHPICCISLFLHRCYKWPRTSYV